MYLSLLCNYCTCAINSLVVVVYDWSKGAEMVWMPRSAQNSCSFSKNSSPCNLYTTLTFASRHANQVSWLKQRGQAKVEEAQRVSNPWASISKICIMKKKAQSAIAGAQIGGPVVPCRYCDWGKELKQKSHDAQGWANWPLHCWHSYLRVAL